MLSRTYTYVKDIKQFKGDIYGRNDSGNIFGSSKASGEKWNVLISGKQGTGKEDCIMIPNILQALRRGEEIVIFDKNKYLFDKTATAAKARGYAVSDKSDEMHNKPALVFIDLKDTCWQEKGGVFEKIMASYHDEIVNVFINNLEVFNVFPGNEGFFEDDSIRFFATTDCLGHGLEDYFQVIIETDEIKHDIIPLNGRMRIKSPDADPMYISRFSYESNQ